MCFEDVVEVRRGMVGGRGVHMSRKERGVDVVCKERGRKGGGGWHGGEVLLCAKVAAQCNDRRARPNTVWYGQSPGPKHSPSDWFLCTLSGIGKTLNPKTQSLSLTCP